MMKRLLAIAAPLALISTSLPALAQDAGGEDNAAAMMEGLASMFPTEPLTAEEKSRLPAAEALVEKIIPPGTMQEVMGGMFDSIMGPLMELSPITAEAALSKRLGRGEAGLGIGEEEAARALELIEPDWRTREEREREVFPELMGNMMVAMEPTIKSAMTELYAIYFNETELADIDRFFSTESGAAYARKSFTMSADPRMVAASMEAMPAMFEALGEIEAMMEERTADLTPPRSFADLSPQERKGLSQITGLSLEELEDGLAGIGASTTVF